MYMSMMPKEYDEPEPDYPVSDSELTNYTSGRRSPELRLFETDDLPLHRGDFTSQHVIMVRSRQSSEIAGLMDESVSNQPTLKRFSRYNQSMHSRPSSQMCELEPGSSQQQQQQQQHQPHTFSKSGGRLKTGFFSGNWTLRGKKDQKMRPSVHNITVVQIGKPSSNSVTAKPPLVPSGTIRSSFPLPPFEQHQQNAHQRCHVNNPRTLDYIHNDDTTSLHNHRVPPPRGPRNFRSDKFYTNSHKKTVPAAAEITQATTALSPFARSSDNFTRFRTAGLSAAAVSRERIIPIEFKVSKDQTVDRHFPVREISQQDSFEKVDEDTDQRYRTLNMKMRLKKSESYDNIGQNGRHLHSQQLSNNNGSDNNPKLLEYSEIMEDNEDRQPKPVTTAQGVTEDGVTDDDGDDVDDESDANRNNESRFGLMRRFGGVKSIGAIRRQWHRPVAEVFPSNAHTRSASKDSGLSSTVVPGSAKRISNSSSSTDERSPTPPPSLSHLLIDADSAYRTGTSESSPSSMSSSNERQQQSVLRKSCPDLRMSGSGKVMPKNMEAYRAQNRNRRAREKKQAALWKKKLIAEWSLDDVLLWLQHCKLDDVASVMIGYDINGADVERWNDEILEQLGVTEEKTRTKVLHELKVLKERQTSPPDNVNDGVGTKIKKGKPRVPLFKLVRSTSYDKVVAVETPLTTRDITVAEGRFGCLQVTKVNGANIPLREQDCFLEINEMPGQAFRSPLMFTKLVTEAAGEPIRLVVLRRRMLPAGMDGDFDDDNDTSSRGTFHEKPLQAVDQESSASSGVSSSELSSEVIPLNDDSKSQVLRL